MKNVFGRLRISLAQCLALLTLIAIWSTVYRLRTESGRMRHELETYSAFKPVLLIDDFSKLTVLEEPKNWDHEIAWQIYVPSGSRLQLRASHQKQATESVDPSEVVVDLPVGRHRIAFKHAFPMSFRANATPKEYLYLLVDENQLVLDSREVEDAVNQMKIPRQSLKGQRYERSPQEPLTILHPTKPKHLPWSLTLEPSKL